MSVIFFKHSRERGLESRASACVPRDISPREQGGGELSIDSRRVYTVVDTPSALDMSANAEKLR